MLFDDTLVELIGPDGVPLVEHRVTSSVEGGHQVVSCYVESRDGMRFSLRWTQPKYGKDQQGAFILDGIRVVSIRRRATEDHCIDHIGARVDKAGTKRRPYTFSKIKLTDDELHATTSEAVVKGLGIARFVVHDALYGPSEAIRNSWGPHRIKGTEGMQFDEKSKKAQLSQSAGLGETIQVASPKAKRHSRPLLWKDPAPRVVFEWRYRSRDLLESEGIVERVATSAGEGKPPAAGASSPRRVKNRPSLSAAVVDLSGGDNRTSTAKDVKLFKKRGHPDPEVIDLRDVPAKKPKAEPMDPNLRGKIIDLT